MARYAVRHPERVRESLRASRETYRKNNPRREFELYTQRRLADPEFDRRERSRLNEWHRRWTKNNHDKKFAWNAEARARKLNATPPWLSEEHRRQIRAIYREAKNRDGGPWDVDHIIPLKGVGVSGLHVPWNLRIVPAAENRSKGAKLIPGLVEILTAA